MSRKLAVDFSLLLVGTMVAYVATRLLCLGPLLNDLLTERREEIYPALVGLEGSLLGFTVASLTIMLGYSASPHLAVVRESRNWQALFDAFTASIRWVGFATVLSVVALLVDRDSSPILLIETALGVVLVISSVMVARMLWVIHRVVAVVTRPGARAPGA